jgi:two-component sensor histidine kinase
VVRSWSAREIFKSANRGIKHAFPDKPRGTIRVGLQSQGEDVLLFIEDDGVGLPATRRTGSMGMRLIEGMARSLNGTLATEGDRRTWIQVRFPLTSERNNPAG